MLRARAAGRVVGLAAMCALGCAKTSPAPAPPATAHTETAIYEHTVQAPLPAVAADLRVALAEAGFSVSHELDVDASLSARASQWRSDYNRSGLEAIRSFSVPCPPEYANALANANPGALALCPLRITLVQKDDETTIFFARPSASTRTAAASSVATQMEADLVASLERLGPTPTSTEAPPACTYDTECPSERVCERHECIRWWQLSGATPEVPPEELASLVESGDIQVLDVRTAAEFEQGHINGALSVPLGRLEGAMYDLPLRRDTPVVAVCLTAHRSIPAARLLKRLGYEALHLGGGMQAWRRAGLPEVQNRPPTPPVP